LFSSIYHIVFYILNYFKETKGHNWFKCTLCHLLGIIFVFFHWRLNSEFSISLFLIGFLNLFHISQALNLEDLLDFPIFPYNIILLWLGFDPFWIVTPLPYGFYLVVPTKQFKTNKQLCTLITSLKFRANKAKSYREIPLWVLEG